MPAKEKKERYVLIKAVCPYYKTSERTSVRCEGTNDTTLRITFQTKELLREHADSYCCSRWRLCPYAQIHK